MMLDGLKHLDTTLFFFLNNDCQNRLFDIVMPVITGRANIIVLPFLLLFLIKERKKALVLFAVSFLSILLSDATAHALKEIIGRQRPCTVLQGVHLLTGCSDSFSMPSSHSINAFGFAVPFLLMSRSRLRYVFIFIAALVGISRVFVGVHYPFDVLVGAAGGSFCAIAVVCFYRRAEERFREKPYTTVLYVFLFILSIFRIYYILYGPLDLSADEAHYWEWSRRLDLSYYSKGPMISYLIAAGTALFGDNVFGVRILAVVSSFLSSLTLYKLGKEMFDERAGAASAVLFQLIPLYSVYGVIFTIDAPFMLFWVLSLYLLWKAVNQAKCQRVTESKCQISRMADTPTPGNPDARRHYWILLGVTVGCGLLTKYTMAFFYVCALLFLLFSEKKRVLKTFGPYISLLISLVVFSPVIIWNSYHGWVTFRHTAGQAHVAEGLTISAKSFIEFAGSQLGILTPVICVMAFMALRKLKMTGTQAGKLLFWFCVPVVVFFLIKSIQGKVQANWAMMGYVTAILAFSAVFPDGWERHNRFLKIIVIIGITLSAALTAVAHYPTKFHIPLQLDPSARLRGWKELGAATDTLYRSSLLKGEPFVFSDSYQVSGELAFYMKRHPMTYCINMGRRMNQYDLWPKFDKRIHSDAIFVTIGDTELPAAVRNAFVTHSKDLYRVFEKGKLLREYSLFVCRDFTGMKEESIRNY